jgi:hypothetical protein
VAQLVQDVCGVQAQDASAMPLALRARSPGLTALDVERARVHERSVVRTWCMRGTLHLLAAQDLGWLLALLGPGFIRATRRRYVELGLDEATCARAMRALRDMLGSGGPLTRAELARQLAARGIPSHGQAAPHLLRRAALEGLICYGPDRDGEPTYVLLQDWVDVERVMVGDTARAELARRYLEAYAPAGPEDLAAWSGLALSEARAGFERLAVQLIPVDMAGSPGWLLQSQAAWLDEPSAGGVVRLLPSFDPYLLGYRNRDLVVSTQHARRIHPGGGWLHPALLVDGRAAGTWKTRRKKNGLVVVVEPFERLDPDVTPGLEEEVQDLGHFLGLDATLSLAAPG